MNIHEHQAKAVLKEFGVPVPRGYAAFTVDEAVKAAQELGGPGVVVKSQIHAGGRGQGKFESLRPDAQGGVRRGQAGGRPKTKPPPVARRRAGHAPARPKG